MRLRGGTIPQSGFEIEMRVLGPHQIPVKPRVAEQSRIEELVSLSHSAHWQNVLWCGTSVVEWHSRIGRWADAKYKLVEFVTLWSSSGTAKRSMVQLRLGAQHIPSPVKPRVGLVHQMWASSSSIQFIGQLFISKPFEFRDELLIFQRTLSNRIYLLLKNGNSN